MKKTRMYYIITCVNENGYWWNNKAKKWQTQNGQYNRLSADRKLASMKSAIKALKQVPIDKEFAMYQMLSTKRGHVTIRVWNEK